MLTRGWHGEREEAKDRVMAERLGQCGYPTVCTYLTSDKVDKACCYDRFKDIRVCDEARGVTGVHLSPPTAGGDVFEL